MLAKGETADIGQMTESRNSSMSRVHRTITFTSASGLDRELRLARLPESC